MDVALEAPATARTILRDACEAAHARVDARLSAYNFNDRDAYTDMLSRLSEPLSAWEGALSAGLAPHVLFDWRARLRAPALRADLAHLGGAFRSSMVAPLSDEAETLGAVYVLEGSRLGGRVLARWAQESADPLVRGATRYFHHGETAGFWRSFLAVLERSWAVRAQPARAIDAARAVFASFEAALT